MEKLSTLCFLPIFHISSNCVRIFAPKMAKKGCKLRPLPNIKERGSEYDIEELQTKLQINLSFAALCDTFPHILTYFAQSQDTVLQFNQYFSLLKKAEVNNLQTWDGAVVCLRRKSIEERNPLSRQKEGKKWNKIQPERSLLTIQQFLFELN